MSHYPISLVNLTHALVIGGGAVATRKVHGLLAAGARVTIIAPEISEELAALAHAHALTILRRAYQPDDLARAQIVIAATDDLAVNHAVSADAQARGMLVNVVDDPAYCTFHVPAIIRRGNIALAISTGGASPALAKYLRRELERVIGAEYETLAALLAELRPIIQTRVPRENRETLWENLIDAALPLLRAGRTDEARQSAEQLVAKYKA